MKIVQDFPSNGSLSLLSSSFYIVVSSETWWWWWRFFSKQGRQEWRQGRPSRIIALFNIFNVQWWKKKWWLVSLRCLHHHLLLLLDILWGNKNAKTFEIKINFSVLCCRSMGRIEIAIFSVFFFIIWNEAHYNMPKRRVNIIIYDIWYVV